MYITRGDLNHHLTADILLVQSVSLNRISCWLFANDGADGSYHAQLTIASSTSQDALKM
jgi:hypothetical protein